jgi:hypothetical protein
MLSQLSPSSRCRSNAGLKKRPQQKKKHPMTDLRLEMGKDLSDESADEFGLRHPLFCSFHF